MITEKDKQNIVKALQTVDVKQMNIEHNDDDFIKWFRFGSYNGLSVAQEIIRQLPTGKKSTKIKVD